MWDKTEVVLRESIPSQRFRRGVTLAEMTVVLGVIAAIVAAIWSASGPLQAKQKVARAKDEINLIVNNVRSYYGGRPLTATGVCSVKSSLTQMGTQIFPPSMVVGGVVRNPWRGISRVYMCETNPVKMVVRFEGVPREECIKLLMDTSSEFAGMHLIQINVNSDTTAVTTGNAVLFPTATTSCSPSGGTIDWYFRVSG